MRNDGSGTKFAHDPHIFKTERITADATRLLFIQRHGIEKHRPEGYIDVAAPTEIILQSINYNATVSSDLYVVISAVCGRVFVVAASRVMMTGISTSLIRDCRLCCQRQK